MADEEILQIEGMGLGGESERRHYGGENLSNFNLETCMFIEQLMCSKSFTRDSREAIYSVTYIFQGWISQWNSYLFCEASRYWGQSPDLAVRRAETSLAGSPSSCDLGEIIYL